jgi:2-desacetyl-2-hydroxyethyl bacteriochlorophyllide A dehydrogenase
MKAALLVAPGRVIVDDIADSQVGPDDVQIQVGGVGLCGSDSSVFSGKWPTPSTPWIMGHEAFGRVIAVGERVPEQRIGETVVVEPNIACFRCGPCQRGLTSACENRLSVGMNRPGALVERLVVTSRFAWHIDGLEPQALVCVEPLAVVEAALRRLSGELPIATLVVGAGPQGLLMSLALMMRGVDVHVLDVNGERLAFAGRLGAKIEPIEQQFDLVVDSVGSPAAHESAVEHTAPGATILVLGLDDRPLGLAARTLVRRQLELRGSLTYDHPVDFRNTIDLVSSTKLDPGRIVAHEFALDDVQDAFEAAPHAPGKTWVRVA